MNPMRREFLAIAIAAVIAGACGDDGDAVELISAQSTDVTTSTADVDAESVSQYCDTPDVAGNEVDPSHPTDDLHNSVWVRVPYESAVALFQGEASPLEVVTTAGRNFTITPAAPERTKGLVSVALAAEAPAVDAIYVRAGGQSGRALAIAVTRIDGTVGFYSTCGIVQARTGDFDLFADWLRDDLGGTEAMTDSQLLELVLSEPPPRTEHVERYWDFLDLTAEPTAWADLSLDSRFLSDPRAPGDVLGQHVFLPAIAIDVPESWTGKDRLLCTRVDDGWGGHCAPLSLGDLLTVGMYLPLDGSDIELWLWDASGAAGMQIAAIGTIDGGVLLQAAADSTIDQIPLVSVDGPLDLSVLEEGRSVATASVSTTSMRSSISEADEVDVAGD